MANVAALQQAILSGNRAAVDAQIATMSLADVPVVMSFFNGLGTADKQALAAVFDKNPNIVPGNLQGTVRSVLADIPRGPPSAPTTPTRWRGVEATPAAQRTPAPQTPRAPTPQQPATQPTRAQPAPQQPTRPQPAQQPQERRGLFQGGFLSRIFNRPTGAAQQPGARPSRGPIATAFANMFGGGSFGGAPSAPSTAPTVAANNPSSGYYGANPVEYGMGASVAPPGWSFSGGLYSRN